MSEGGRLFQTSAEPFRATVGRQVGLSRKLLKLCKRVGGTVAGERPPAARERRNRWKAVGLSRKLFIKTFPRNRWRQVGLSQSLKTFCGTRTARSPDHLTPVSPVLLGLLFP
uniref:Orf virus homologue of retroviral pseudoprotease protein n=1 Tax=Orf virus TaxID=10258 RepID=Q85304_ORFV|nr:ORF7 [Orf virus]